MTRPLDVRLREYRDILLHTADDIDATLARLPSQPRDDDDREARAVLGSVAQFQRKYAEDMTTLLIGDEELESWAITGELPPGGGPL